jgi:hypothetical protein
MKKHLSHASLSVTYLYDKEITLSQLGAGQNLLLPSVTTLIVLM